MVNKIRARQYQRFKRIKSGVASSSGNYAETSKALFRDLFRSDSAIAGNKQSKSDSVFSSNTFSFTNI